MDVNRARPIWLSKKLWVIAALYIINVIIARAVPYYQWVEAGRKCSELSEQLDMELEKLSALDSLIEDTERELADKQADLAQQGGSQ